MKANCDICGKVDCWVEPLTEGYATQDIKLVCETCLRELNKHLDHLQRMTAQMNKTWIKRFATNLKERYFK